MKKIFIPAGEAVSYNSLNTGRVVVHGALHVHGRLVAKEIIGSGIVEAGEIVCNDMRVSCVTADCATARNIAVDKLFVRFECRASGQIAVRDYLSAGYVCTGTLSVSLSDVGSCDADKVIMVRQRGSLLGLLWASWWRGLYLGLIHGGTVENADEDDPVATIPIREGTAITPIHERKAVADEIHAADAVALMVTVLSSLRDRGYRVSRVNPASEKEAAA